MTGMRSRSRGQSPGSPGLVPTTHNFVIPVREEWRGAGDRADANPGSADLPEALLHAHCRWDLALPGADLAASPPSLFYHWSCGAIGPHVGAARQGRTSGDGVQCVNRASIPGAAAQLRTWGRQHEAARPGAAPQIENGGPAAQRRASRFGRAWTRDSRGPSDGLATHSKSWLLRRVARPEKLPPADDRWTRRGTGSSAPGSLPGFPYGAT